MDLLEVPVPEVPHPDLLEEPGLLDLLREWRESGPETPRSPAPDVVNGVFGVHRQGDAALRDRGFRDGLCPHRVRM